MPNLDRSNIESPNPLPEHPRELKHKKRSHFLKTKLMLLDQYGVPDFVSKMSDKQISFAQHYIHTKSAITAAKKAGYANPQQGFVIATRPHVKALIAYLEAKNSTKSPRIEKKSLMSALWCVQIEARAARQYGAAVQAIRLMGIEQGMFREQVDVSIRKIDTLSDDDLRAEMKRLQQRMEDAQAIEGELAPKNE